MTPRTMPCPRCRQPSPVTLVYDGIEVSGRLVRALRLAHVRCQRHGRVIAEREAA